MSARTSLLTSIVFTLTAVLAQAQTLDFSSVSVPGAAGARDAVILDVNRDGWPDLATANTGRNTVAILANRADGAGFDPPREIAVGAGPFDVDAGDLNRDGVADLIVTTPDGRAIEVLLMGANGQVASRSLVAPGSQAWGATLSDATRDGILDLIYTDYARDRVVLLPGTAAGGFAAAIGEWVVSAKPQGVVARDFNHDGLVDLAVAATGAAALDVLYGAATGGFTRQTIAAGRFLNVLSAVDLNADGWLEIAAASSSTNVVVIFRGSSSGFAVAGTRPVGSSPRGIAAGDFNQDGRPDLAVANYGSATVTLLLGRRDGSVLPDDWGDLPASSGARGIATADFNHDGRLDLAVGSQSAGRVWLHDNTTPFVAPAFSFRAEAGEFYGVAAGDFNENGLPDLLMDRAVLLDGTTRVTLAESPWAFLVGGDTSDFNRDGHRDALLARVGYDEGRQVWESFLEFYAGNGRGGFGPVQRIDGLPLHMHGIRTGDLNRDGRLDVVAFSEEEVMVVRGVGFTATRQVVITGPNIGALELADITRDGVLDVVVSRDEYTVYPGNGAGGFGTGVAAGGRRASSFALGDMNHDGRLDIVADDGNSIEVILAADDGGWQSAVEYPSNIPWDTQSGTILGDFNNDGHLDVLSWGGAMLFGDGQGRLGPAMEFETRPRAGLAFDWNRDGLLDIVESGRILLNERRAVNRPPVAEAGPDRSYTFDEHIWDDEWCERGTPSVDADLHRVSFQWRDETGTPFGCTMPPHAPGTYTFTVTVRDGRGGESSDTLRVTIAPKPEIVLYAAYVDLRAPWRTVFDPTAAPVARLYYPNLGGPKTPAPEAAPAAYADRWFNADPTQTYKLWVRLKADGNSWANDSIWMQFGGAIASDGRSYAIGTTSGLPINLEECSGCGVSNWGWEDDGWGAVNRNGVTLRFPEGGQQRIRIQVREDGVSVDQIVLSAVKYLTTRPGTAKNDTVILPDGQ
jgi:hypothetical protein